MSISSMKEHQIDGSLWKYVVFSATIQINTSKLYKIQKSLIIAKRKLKTGATVCMEDNK